MPRKLSAAFFVLFKNSLLATLRSALAKSISACLRSNKIPATSVAAPPSKTDLSKKSTTNFPKLIVALGNVCSKLITKSAIANCICPTDSITLALASIIELAIFMPNLSMPPAESIISCIASAITVCRLSKTGKNEVVMLFMKEPSCIFTTPTASLNASVLLMTLSERTIPKSFAL